MFNIDKKHLASLYKSEDIIREWKAYQDKAVIDLNQGKISPNKYRAQYHGRPCPFCGKKMVHGQDLHSTKRKDEAIDRGY